MDDTDRGDATRGLVERLGLDGAAGALEAVGVAAPSRERLGRWAVAGGLMLATLTNSIGQAYAGPATASTATGAEPTSAGAAVTSVAAADPADDNLRHIADPTVLRALRTELEHHAGGRRTTSDHRGATGADGADAPPAAAGEIIATPHTRSSMQESLDIISRTAGDRPIIVVTPEDAKQRPDAVRDMFERAEAEHGGIHPMKTSSGKDPASFFIGRARMIGDDQNPVPFGAFRAETAGGGRIGVVVAADPSEVDGEAVVDSFTHVTSDKARDLAPERFGVEPRRVAQMIMVHETAHAVDDENLDPYRDALTAKNLPEARREGQDAELAADLAVMRSDEFTAREKNFFRAMRSANDVASLEMWEQHAVYGSSGYLHGNGNPVSSMHADQSAGIIDMSPGAFLDHENPAFRAGARLRYALGAAAFADGADGDAAATGVERGIRSFFRDAKTKNGEFEGVTQSGKKKLHGLLNEMYFDETSPRGALFAAAEMEGVPNGEVVGHILAATGSARLRSGARASRSSFAARAAAADASGPERAVLKDTAMFLDAAATSRPPDAEVRRTVHGALSALDRGGDVDADTLVSVLAADGKKTRSAERNAGPPPPKLAQSPAARNGGAASSGTPPPDRPAVDPRAESAAAPDTNAPPRANANRRPSAAGRRRDPPTHET